MDFVTYFNRVFAKPFRWGVYGASVDEGSGVKLGKHANQGRRFASSLLNYGKSIYLHRVEQINRPEGTELARRDLEVLERKIARCRPRAVKLRGELACSRGGSEG